jgi:sulfite reductase beta subunit-like hemoprotein
LTTRQDIELHDLTEKQVPVVQGQLAEAGMTGLGASGDSLRNITVCPCSGAVRGRKDVLPLGRGIQAALEQIPGILAMPRKFKISLSCGTECGQAWINDLGLVAKKEDGKWGFFVTVGGSLGAKPGGGIKLFDWIPPEDVCPLAVATVCVFIDHADRNDRTHARLRHVRERIGDDAFAKTLEKAFKAAKSERHWPQAELPEASDRFGASLTLTFANGDVTPEAGEALGQLESCDELRVRIGCHHQIVIFGPDEGSLGQKVSQFSELKRAANEQMTVVACPGKRWCRRALVRTDRMADRIRAELATKIPPAMAVCISGCPNGCAHSTVADIGLVGGITTIKGEKREVFDLFWGGGMGKDNRLANPLARKLSCDDVVAEITRRVVGD